MTHYFRHAGLILGTTTLLACTVLQPLSNDAQRLQTELHHGDVVQIISPSGQQKQVTVDTVDAQGIHSAAGDIAFADIREINRQKISAGRTALLVLGIAAGGALAAGGGGGSGGGGY